MSLQWADVQIVCFVMHIIIFQNNADVDVTTDYGMTPLMTACSSKGVDETAMNTIVRLLVEYGADHEMKDYRNKRTALQVNLHKATLLWNIGKQCRHCILLDGKGVRAK